MKKYNFKDFNSKWDALKFINNTDNIIIISIVVIVGVYKDSLWQIWYEELPI